MTRSPLTTRTSPDGGQHGPRSRGVDRFVVHHAASVGLDGVLDLMATGRREVSANYVVKDAAIVSVVDEDHRSWSLTSAEWDSRSITVETCNSAYGDASGWPISEASYASLARLIADCATRHGFPVDRDHVIGHREVYSRHGASYATACPGGIDLDRLVAMARAITDQTPTTTQEDPMYRVALTQEAGPALAGRVYLVTANGHQHLSPPASAALDALGAPAPVALAFGLFWELISGIDQLNRTGSALLADDDIARVAAARGLPAA